MAMKTGDFVELDVVGKVVATDQIFDSTVEKKQPVIVCVGKKMIFPKIDSFLEAKNIGDEFDIELRPEESFGVRQKELVQLTNINTFRRNNLNPAPGMQVNIDGALATIRSVTGGRVTMDFNHPLAGKAVKFHIKIRKLVTDVKEKVKALCVDWRPSVKETEKGLEVSLDGIKLPEKIAELKIKQIKDLIPEIKDKEIKFTAADLGKPHEHDHQEQPA
jgi:FKBP-type peptidyl-prolyl cis-trans isomerase 2